MTEYKATFNEVITIKKALKIYLAILESQAGSVYELSHSEILFVLVKLLIL